jgi:hypothetical protein
MPKPHCLRTLFVSSLEDSLDATAGTHRSSSIKLATRALEAGRETEDERVVCSFGGILVRAEEPSLLPCNDRFGPHNQET